MKFSDNVHQSIRLTLRVFLVFSLSAALFLVVYQYDNKYTVTAPKAQAGILTLSSEVLTSSPVLFLVDGWEYYDGLLLTPKDFQTNPPIPDQYIFIGQFGGFEMGNGGSPHGSASYRLNIHIPAQPDTYLLELPEIFSAYRLYINGRLAVQMGQPDAHRYQPATGNRTVSIEAGQNIELLFAVADYSHLYSGIVYPPAFGQPTALSQLLNSRLIFRSLLCAVALTVGLLSVMVGLLAHRDILALQFGLLCICFVGYAGYPLVQTIFAGFGIAYVIEHLSFCAMLGIAMLIAIRVSGLSRKWQITAIILGFSMCILSLLLHFLLPLGNLSMMLGYSSLISAYEWTVSGIISATIWSALRNDARRITPLLYGNIIFDCALIADRLLPMHEPILSGWFIELASFALILCIGTITGQEVAARYRLSTVMSERSHNMERLYQSQLSHFQTLKKEIEQVKTMRHDLRHHLTILDQYIQNCQYEKLREYMAEYHTASIYGEMPDYCPIDVINTLTHHYYMVAKENLIRLDIRCNLKAALKPSQTNMSDADLCCLYSNLVENAVEACLQIPAAKRLIRVAIFRIDAQRLDIRVWNNANHVLAKEGRFLSHKNNQLSGFGLSSVEAIVKKYDGTAEFLWHADQQQFESRITVIA